MIHKIKIHSTVDLITNSSSIIYTYQDGSLKAIEELVNEMIKALNPDSGLTFNDLFYAGVFADSDVYLNYLDENDDDEEEIAFSGDDKEFDIFIDKILTKQIEKPEWMEQAEEENCYGYSPSRSLCLKVKDEKYKNLADKLLSYLNSTDHEASYG